LERSDRNKRGAGIYARLNATIFSCPNGVEQAFMPAAKHRQTSASAAEIKNSKELYEVHSEQAGAQATERERNSEDAAGNDSATGNSLEEK
jgi:hypothetical protein